MFDCVAAMKRPLVIDTPEGRRFELPSPACIAEAVKHCPTRYVIDDAVTAFAANFAFQESERLAACLDLVRLPSQQIWIEWRDGPRVEALSGASSADAFKLGRRVGLLVQADVDCRRGTIELVWMHDEAVADLSPIFLEFDFDDRDFCERRNAPTLSWGAELRGHGGLSQIGRHVRYCLRPEWARYYLSRALTSEQQREILIANCEAVATDFPFLMAFALTLMARNAVRLQANELERLNRSRRRSGKADLLDYVEVFARIDGVAANASSTGNEVRAAARLHFVTGHLVRRARQVFWRRGHLRGNAARGAVLGRNIHLRMGSNVTLDALTGPSAA